MNFKKMIRYEDDSTYTEVNTLDLDKYGEKAYNQTEVLLFHVIKKQKIGQ